MEQFEGIAILATNRKNDVDQPSCAGCASSSTSSRPARRSGAACGGWRSAAHALGRRSARRIDWDSLAERLDMTGADIKLAALGAAFLARGAGTRIGMRHVLACVAAGADQARACTAGD